MAEADTWTISKIVDGVTTIELDSWRSFHGFVYEQMLTRTSYIWRGQRCESWELESSLDRILRAVGDANNYEKEQAHLNKFKFAARGRRGKNPLAFTGGNADNEWWALGQHNGLATPLLDWTRSPFAAAYFSFIESALPQTPKRAVYALAEAEVTEKSKLRWKEGIRLEPYGRLDFQFFRPKSDENPRLVNQDALFTRAPAGTSVEQWVKDVFRGEQEAPILIKITIPDSERDVCLRSLNRMNINHLTLFPDLLGSSTYCNLHLEIKNY